MVASRRVRGFDRRYSQTILSWITSGFRPVMEKPSPHFAWLLLALLLWHAIPRAAAEPPLTLAIHPYLPATELSTRFTPLAKYLEERLGRPVELRISRSYASHIDQFSQGEIDIAYFGPLSYVALTEKQPAPELLAVQETHGETRFRGVIFVGKDAPFHTIKDLAGTRIAFVDPLSTMGYSVPMAILERQGITADDFASIAFLGGHENVALGVLMGHFDAGAVKDETFEAYRNRGLRAIAVTPPIPDHLFVAARKLNSETIKALRAALLELAKTPGGGSILRAIKPDLTALAPVRDEDYDELRAWVTPISGGK